MLMYQKGIKYKVLSPHSRLQVENVKNNLNWFLYCIDHNHFAAFNTLLLRHLPVDRARPGVIHQN